MDLWGPRSYKTLVLEGLKMTGSAASAGDIVTCIERNHPMFRITRDVNRLEIIRAVDFESLQESIPAPAVNALMPRTCPCGSLYSWVENGGLKFHFGNTGV